MLWGQGVETFFFEKRLMWTSALFLIDHAGEPDRLCDRVH